MHTLQAMPHILVVQPRRALCIQILADIRRIYPKAKVAHALDLTEAYNLAEHAQPDLVLLDHSHERASGLSMFFLMLAALSIDWIMLSGDSPIASIPLKNQAHHRKLERALVDAWSFRAGSRSSQKRSALGHSAQAPGREVRNWKPVVIGASTGGIEALIETLPHFPENGPPTVIVQHINASFIPGLAQRLDRLCPANVRPALPDNRLEAGQILLAPGEDNHLVVTNGGRRCQLKPGPPLNGHRPSVDALFTSAAQHLGSECVGVLLSGMGCDGAFGLREIRTRGGWTIAQDEATCTVFGMPRAAVELHAVNEQLPTDKIAKAVLKASAKTKKKTQNA